MLFGLFGGATAPRLPDVGPYLLRITTQAGAVIEQRFATREVDHDGGRERFGFTIAHPGAIDRLEVLRDGRLVHQRAARVRTLAAPSTAAQPTVQASEQGGMLDLRWDATRHAYLTVSHIGTVRTVIGVDLRSGAASLPIAALPAGGQFEFGLSDGLNTQRLARAR